MTKFKVGDKAEVIEKTYNSKQVGDIVQIASVNNLFITTTEGDNIMTRKLKLVEEPKSMFERVTSLEKEVDELKKIVEDIQSHNPKQVDLPQFLAGVDWGIGTAVSNVFHPQSNNQKRAAIIEKAKQILSKELPRWNFYQNEFVINEEKRTVVLLRKHMDDKKIFARGIAKCHPNDVFNEDIGKIIAFGRATGYPTEEFEQAVQPDEVVVGMLVTNIQNPEGYEVKGGFYKVGSIEKGLAYDAIPFGYVPTKYLRITNDTNAEYPS